MKGIHGILTSTATGLRSAASVLSVQRWLMVAILATGTMVFVIYLADFAGGDASPKLIVATGFYDTAAYRDGSQPALKLQFRYNNSASTIAVTRIAGPSRYRLLLSGIDPDSCALGDASLPHTALNPNDWVQPPASFAGAHPLQHALYQFSVDDHGDLLGEVHCRLTIQPSILSHDIREIHFLHSPQPKDARWLETASKSVLDQFVFADFDGENVRGDDEATFKLKKRDAREIANEMISSDVNAANGVQPVRRLRSYVASSRSHLPAAEFPRHRHQPGEVAAAV